MKTLRHEQHDTFYMKLVQLRIHRPSLTVGLLFWCLSVNGAERRSTTADGSQNLQAGEVPRISPRANQLTFPSSLVSLICTGRQWNIYKELYRQLH